MKAVLGIFDEIGAALIFLREVTTTYWRTGCERDALLRQIWLVSTNSVVTTASSGFFVGAIMAMQFNAQLKEFGALSVLGGLSTSGTIRELGPLLIAFMLSGKVGAYTSAELGTMKVTEQIDAMRCLGTNPIQYLVIPRFLAIVISSFFLLLAGLLMSILGGITLSLFVANMSAAEYVQNIPVYVTGASVLNGLFKCFMFSFLLATICTYKGYATKGGAKGVGKTVIQTALSTMVGINLMDWFTSYLARAVSEIAGRGGL